VEPSAERTPEHEELRPETSAHYTSAHYTSAHDTVFAQNTSAQRASAQQRPAHPGFSSIDLEQRNTLEAQGHPPLWANNGPKDGFPEFSVPTSTARQLYSPPTPSPFRSKPIPTDPVLLSENREPTKRRTRSASRQKLTG
jgi:hypothetical protein